MENPIKMDDLERKPTIFGNIHIGYETLSSYIDNKSHEVIGSRNLNPINPCMVMVYSYLHLVDFYGKLGSIPWPYGSVLGLFHVMSECNLESVQVGFVAHDQSYTEQCEDALFGFLGTFQVRWASGWQSMVKNHGCHSQGGEWYKVGHYQPVLNGEKNGASINGRKMPNG